jgi:hypothetical protein
MYINGLAGGDTTIVLTNIHTETNSDLASTYAIGTNRADRSGLIRLGIDPTWFGVQHSLYMANCSNSVQGGIASFSTIQCTSAAGTYTTGVAFDHAQALHLRLLHCRGMCNEPVGPTASTGTVKLLGNVPTYFEARRSSSVFLGSFYRAGGASSNSATEPAVDEMTLYAPSVQDGTGAPTYQAPGGSLYMRRDGSTSTSLYVNTDGGTTWTAK